MRKFVAKKRFIAIYALALVLLTATVGIGVYDFGVKAGTIHVDGEQIEAKTNLDTVGEILEEKEVTLNEADEVKPSVDTELEDNFEIEVKRAKPVVLTVDGESKEILTVKNTVGEFLEQESVYYDDVDRITPSVDTELTSHLEVELTRITEAVRTVEEEIEFEVQEKDNPDLERGKKKVAQEGALGQKTSKVKEIYENGELVSSEEIETEVTKKPQNKIVEVGTKAPVSTTNSTNSSNSTATRSSSSNRTSQSGSVSGSGTMFQASAYTGSDGENGGYGGITASGSRLRPGVIAVDRNVIPLGTRVYIEYPNGTPMGYFVAEDVGGAIKGNKVDIYMESRSQALSFGRRNMKVYVLD